MHQSVPAECGLVCLAMVAGAHGLDFDLVSLRSIYPVSLRGMTLRAIIEIARELGFETRAIRCEIEDLQAIRAPAILHWRGEHFVAFSKKIGSHFLIHDPAIGRVKLKYAEMDEAFTGVALEIWPSPDFRPRRIGSRLRLAAVIPKDGWITRALLSLFVLSLGLELATLCLPVLEQFVIDDVLPSDDKHLLVTLAVATGIMLLTSAVTKAVSSLISRNLTSGLSLLVPSNIFQHLLSLPSFWFEVRAPAEVLNRFGSGNTIQQTISTDILEAAVDGVVAILAGLGMLVYNAELAAIVFATTAAYGLSRFLWYGSYRRLSAGSLVATSKVQGLMWETLGGISTIKIFNKLPQRLAQFQSLSSKYVKLQNGIMTANTNYAFGHDVLFGIEQVAVLYLSAEAVLNGHLTIGMITAFLSFRDNFSTKVSDLIDTGIQVKLLSVQLDRLADIVLSPKEERSYAAGMVDPELFELLELKSVTFRYSNNEADVLYNYSFRIGCGEAIAIVGPSGAGKSTLFKILTGQLTPRFGEMLINGQPLTALGMERWREIIGVVRQDDLLFSGTIAENIAFLDDFPDHEKIHKCAEIAGILDDIKRMPMGFGTRVGTANSTGLSGGQAQRVMIARALYRKPTILFLDEATSSLDVKSEQAIIRRLRSLNLTIVMIAHRPETIATADRIVDICAINSVSATRSIPTSQST